MIPEIVKARLRGLRTRLYALVTLEGLARLLVVLGILVVLTFLFDWATPLPAQLRLILTIVCVIIICITFWRALILPLSASKTDDQIAVAAERRFPDLKDRLISTVQLSRLGPDEGFFNSPELVEALVEETREEMGRRKFRGVFSIGTTLKFWGLAALFIIGIAGFAAAEEDTTLLYLKRYLTPFSAPDWPKYNKLKVSDDLVQTVAKGDDVEIKIESVGRYHPATVWIYSKFESQDKWEESPMLKYGTTSFRKTFENVNEPFSFYAVGGDAQTPPYGIIVKIRPHVEELKVWLKYPDYTGEEPTPQNRPIKTGNLHVLAGTLVEFAATSNNALKRARLVMETAEIRGQDKPRNLVELLTELRAKQPSGDYAGFFEALEKKLGAKASEVLGQYEQLAVGTEDFGISREELEKQFGKSAELKALMPAAAGGAAPESEGGTVTGGEAIAALAQGARKEFLRLKQVIDQAREGVGRNTWGAGKFEDDKTFRGKFYAWRTMQYRFELVDTDGFDNYTNHKPVTYNLRVMRDRPPSIKFVKPARNTMMTPNATLPMSIEIKDEYGIKDVVLKYVKMKESEQSDEKEITLEFTDADGKPIEIEGKTEEAFDYSFCIEPLEAKVGDTIIYFAESHDFNAQEDAPPGISRKWKISIVTVEELSRTYQDRLLRLKDRLIKVRANQIVGMDRISEISQKVAIALEVLKEEKRGLLDTELDQRKITRDLGSSTEELESIIEGMRSNRIYSEKDLTTWINVSTRLTLLAKQLSPEVAQSIYEVRKQEPEGGYEKAFDSIYKQQAGISNELAEIIRKLEEIADFNEVTRRVREAYDLQTQIGKELGRIIKGETSEDKTLTDEEKARVAELIPMLKNPDSKIREDAVDELREITGQSFGFDPAGSEQGRDEAVSKWEEWWKEQGK